MRRLNNVARHLRRLASDPADGVRGAMLGRVDDRIVYRVGWRTTGRVSDRIWTRVWRPISVRVAEVRSAQA